MTRGTRSGGYAAADSEITSFCHHPEHIGKDRRLVMPLIVVKRLTLKCSLATTARTLLKVTPLMIVSHVAQVSSSPTSARCHQNA
ncbi:MAG: hypothetical protein RMJ19_05290 [Gemmatales bacterium]|nr:hypothetical protein [Gemmatales bacterium]MDW8175067.1 hypothetical protein [Gemmatales bacterium]